jgi:hypothetical protein
MSDDSQNIAPTTQDAKKQSVSDWLQTEITLTVSRWMLVAGGIAALVLLLVALD